MEPLFFPEDEQYLLPQELHPPTKDLGSIADLDLETGRRGWNTSGAGEGEDKDKPAGGGDGGGGGDDEEEEIEIEHQRQRREEALPYDRHSVHVVTQYYIPDDPSRAREVWTSCLEACLCGGGWTVLGAMPFSP